MSLYSFQLPLSGSLGVHTIRKVWIHHFQLPLSGSQTTISFDLPRGRWAAFNSLSRDHSSLEADEIYGGGEGRLSTPSLGITVKVTAHSFSWKNSAFQLSLSGSRTGYLRASAYIVELSTPSLGITFVLCDACCIYSERSFNSLSRDHQRRVRYVSTDVFCCWSFNSLSRDHRALFRDFPALRGFPPRRPFAHLYFSATI